MTSKRGVVLCQPKTELRVSSSGRPKGTPLLQSSQEPPARRQPALGELILAIEGGDREGKGSDQWSSFLFDAAPLGRAGQIALAEEMGNGLFLNPLLMRWKGF